MVKGQMVAWWSWPDHIGAAAGGAAASRP